MSAAPWRMNRAALAEEDGGAEPVVGGPVAVRAGDAFDEPVEPEAAQVVGHLPHGHGLGGAAEHGCHVGAQVTVGELVGQETEPTIAESRAWTRGSPKRRPATRRPSRSSGAVVRSKAAWPAAGSWLIR